MPKQEMFAFEFRNLLNMPILAVGAAFPFLAGKLRQAPPWMQAVGLEWLFPSAFRAEAFGGAGNGVFESGLFISPCAAGSASISIRDRRPATR